MPVSTCFALTLGPLAKQDSELDLAAQLESEWQRRYKPLDKAALKKDELYAEYLERVWQQQHPNEPMPMDDDAGGDDDDIVVASQRISTICPITTTTLVEPVVKCAHA